MKIQNYEEYWKFTNAFTDYNGQGFLKTLRTSVDFIDEHQQEPFNQEKYESLQILLEDELKIDLISVRKAINQLVKMGFINTYLASYHVDCLEYLKAKTNKKREILLSKIVYSNASFNRSATNPSQLHQINFLIKTLVEVGKLNKEEIIALMLVDISIIQKGYLTALELAEYVEKAKEIDFISRKFNQISYLTNLLRKLDDIVFVKDVLYFEEDARIIFGEDLQDKRRLRDPYLHRLYKNQLKEESSAFFKKTKCMVEKLEYPVLIASHIKPFIKSDDIEAYDANNGLLLSKNMDSLFDLGYITFDNQGNIIFAKDLSKEVKDFVSNYSLEPPFLTEQRKAYLEYHRTEVFEKRYIKSFLEL
jgi:putative restriction endonuclease